MAYEEYTIYVGDMILQKQEWPEGLLSPKDLGSMGGRRYTGHIEQVDLTIVTQPVVLPERKTKTGWNESLNEHDVKGF